jgi:hypothetical protein
VEYHFVCSMKRSNHLIIESLKRDLGRFWKGHDVQRKALVPSTLRRTAGGALGALARGCRLIPGSVELRAEALMRFQAAILVPLCLTLSAWSQLTYTVPVMDKSDPGSPLKISGTASFAERIVANSVTSSSNFTVEARNVSEKTIVLLLAYFDEAGPHGSGTHHLIQIDHFFWGDIAPGDSFVLARSRSGKRTYPLEAAVEPKAEVGVQYVQFIDGSTFGDETTAKGILGIRAVILEALRRLDTATDKEEFLALLAQKIQPDDADGFLETFRRTQKRYGTPAARAQVHAGLIVAEGRVSSLRVQAAKK